MISALDAPDRVSRPGLTEEGRKLSPRNITSGVVVVVVVNMLTENTHTNLVIDWRQISNIYNNE